MKRFFKSEVGAAMLWVGASLVMAAILAPWFYQAGKWLGAVAEERELPALIESLAGSCRRARLDRYFERALLFSALVLLPFLVGRLRRSRGGGAVFSGSGGYRRMPWHRGLVQLGAGALISGGLLVVLCLVVVVAGAYEWKEPLPKVGRVLSGAVVPAVAASVVEEWLFRWILLGLWLRFAGPVAAAAGTSLVFAMLHFLDPSASMEIGDPGAAGAGFLLLGGVFLNYLDPRFLTGDFLTLVVVGLILAWARLRGGLLWLPIGLHAGWILVFKASGMYLQTVPESPLHPWAVGNSLKSGILPLVTLAATALACRPLLRRAPALTPSSR